MRIQAKYKNVSIPIEKERASRDPIKSFICFCLASCGTNIFCVSLDVQLRSPFIEALELDRESWHYFF